jgi:hypothetical protein
MNPKKEIGQGQGRWNLLMRSLNPWKKCDIRFEDDIENKKVSLHIEPKCFGGLKTQTWSSFVFEKNSQTSKVDLKYCSLEPDGKRTRRTFRNCTHFGIADYEREGILFELTSEFCDSLFGISWNIFFISLFNQKFIVDSVNKLIETVLNENICEDQPSSTAAYPLCHIQYTGHEKICENRVSNYAKADLSPRYYISDTIITAVTTF